MTLFFDAAGLVSFFAGAFVGIGFTPYLRGILAYLKVMDAKI